MTEIWRIDARRLYELPRSWRVQSQSIRSRQLEVGEEREREIHAYLHRISWTEIGPRSARSTANERARGRRGRSDVGWHRGGRDRGSRRRAQRGRRTKTVVSERTRRTVAGCAGGGGGGAKEGSGGEGRRRDSERGWSVRVRPWFPTSTRLLVLIVSSLPSVSRVRNRTAFARSSGEPCVRVGLGARARARGRGERKESREREREREIVRWRVRKRERERRKEWA